jgi:hypothetical protein
MFRERAIYRCSIGPDQINSGGNGLTKNAQYPRAVLMGWPGADMRKSFGFINQTPITSSLIGIIANKCHYGPLLLALYSIHQPVLKHSIWWTISPIIATFRITFRADSRSNLPNRAICIRTAEEPFPTRLAYILAC